MKRFFSFIMLGLLFGGIWGVGCSQAQDKTFTNSIGMDFVLIPAGKFSNAGESTMTKQMVTISKPFYLGKYEVTQEQWEAVMGKNPSGFNKNPLGLKASTNPVEKVSWDEVQVFIQKLNQKEGGGKYRLPTAAEWEHAARAGTDTEWFFGKDPVPLGEYAWFEENSQGSTHPVGQKKANPWGLYDIYGNVTEWVQDWQDWPPNEEPKGAVTDPTGPESGSHRVSRGGSWESPASICRSAVNLGFEPDSRESTRGFRLAFSPGQ